MWCPCLYYNGMINIKKAQATMKKGERGGVGVSPARSGTEPAGVEEKAAHHRYSAEGRVGDNSANSDHPSPWQNRILISIGQ